MKIIDKARIIGHTKIRYFVDTSATFYACFHFYLFRQQLHVEAFPRTLLTKRKPSVTKSHRLPAIKARPAILSML